MRIDLHVHSNASDGTDAPAEVIRRAAEAGLDVVALTDHDTTAGWPEAQKALPAGLSLLPGMELSCEIKQDGKNRSVHLLTYGFDPTDEDLLGETTLIRGDRSARAMMMVGKINQLGGTDVTWELVMRIADGAVVGRPHIARAMVEAGVIAEPADAFTEEWIADGGRAYVERYSVTAERAIRIVRAAGGVPVLAHPRSPGYEVSDESIERLAEGGLAGLEVFHPDHDAAERTRLTDLAGRLSLVMTGGSDDHGSFNNSGIGSQTTPVDEYQKLVAQIGNAEAELCGSFTCMGYYSDGQKSFGSAPLRVRRG
ncbi:MAG TPA: PHP domain-containing protein [Trebonia sp.]